MAISLVYLEEVIVFTPWFEKHLEHVATVLSLLKDARFTLKLKKWAFFTDTVDNFGHIIMPRKLEVVARTNHAIFGLRETRGVTEMGSFLGLCNVFRRFVPIFARIAAPLNPKLRKNERTKFDHLTEEEGKDFETLKWKLIERTVLALPRGKRRYTVDTDACN